MAVLVRELPDITWKDGYPLSSRMRILGEILGMLRRRAWWRPGFNRVLSRGVSITSRARLTASRSPDLPRRRLRCRVVPGAGPRDNENCGNSLGARRSYEHSRRTDQRTAYTNPVANDLFETNSCAAGTARQSRPGGRATRWSLPTADGTGAGVPTPSTSGASLPVPPAPRPGGTAEYAGLPQQPTRPAMAARASRYQSRQRA